MPHVVWPSPAPSSMPPFEHQSCPTPSPPRMSLRSTALFFIQCTERTVLMMESGGTSCCRRHCVIYGPGWTFVCCRLSRPEKYNSLLLTFYIWHRLLFCDPFVWVRFWTELSEHTNGYIQAFVVNTEAAAAAEATTTPARVNYACHPFVVKFGWRRKLRVGARQC